MFCCLQNFRYKMILKQELIPMQDDPETIGKWGLCGRVQLRMQNAEELTGQQIEVLFSGSSFD